MVDVLITRPNVVRVISLVWSSLQKSCCVQIPILLSIEGSETHINHFDCTTAELFTV